MGTSNLLDYLQDRAGEYHQETIRYDGNETDVLYLTDELERSQLQSQVDRMLRRLRPESSPKEERAFPYGDLHAIVRVFDEAILLHFPTGRDEGVVVVLEPESASDLREFVGDCERELMR